MSFVVFAGGKLVGVCQALSDIPDALSALPFRQSFRIYDSSRAEMLFNGIYGRHLTRLYLWHKLTK
jgi:hypothetical protein